MRPLFQPVLNVSCLGADLGGADFGVCRQMESPSLHRAPIVLALQRRCRLFPLTETTIVSSVVSSATTSFMLLLCGYTLP
jgi:hypothetical protein